MALSALENVTIVAELAGSSMVRVRKRLYK
jgi:hypothetical protein